MFGYVMINKPELKVREYDRYHGYYCGMCRELKKHHGLGGQLTLNYDMVFMAALLTGLYEGEESISSHRCLMHPMTKHEMIDNPYVAYAADMTVLLGYYDLMDNWKDDKHLPSRAEALLLRKGAAGCEKKYKRQAEAVKNYLTDLGSAEAEGVDDLDRIAALTGKMLGEIFVYQEDVWSDTLRECGFWLGKYIYLLDAYEDLEVDRKKGNFNPLASHADRPDFDGWIGEILTLTMASCAQAFERLPILKDAQLLRNILYSGIWMRFKRVQEERRKKQEGETDGSV